MSTLPGLQEKRLAHEWVGLQQYEFMVRTTYPLNVTTSWNKIRLPVDASFTRCKLWIVHRIIVSHNHGELRVNGSFLLQSTVTINIH